MVVECTKYDATLDDLEAMMATREQELDSVFQDGMWLMLNNLVYNCLKARDKEEGNENVRAVRAAPPV